MRKTKIICTLGPSTEDEGVLREMMLAGMDVARFNFSHSTHEKHLEFLNKIKKLREELALPVATLLDTKGPEIRIGKFEKGKVTLKKGDIFTLRTEECIGNEHEVYVNFAGLADDVRPGNTILLDDGLIGLEVVSVNGGDISCRVLNSGVVSDTKGVNVPNVEISIPFISDKDRADIVFGIENGGVYEHAVELYLIGDGSATVGTKSIHSGESMIISTPGVYTVTLRNVGASQVQTLTFTITGYETASMVTGLEDAEVTVNDHDGTVLLRSGALNGLRVYDARNGGKLLRFIETDGRPVLGWSTAGDRMVLLHGDTLSVMDLTKMRTGTPLRGTVILDGYVFTATATDGNSFYALAAGDDGSTELVKLELATFRARSVADLGPGCDTLVWFEEAGRFVALDSKSGGTLYAYSPADGTLITAEGFPAVFCNCAHCRAARANLARERRTRSQALIDGKLLIDFPPDTYLHALAFGVDLSAVRALLVTHSHTDHFYAQEFVNRGYKFAREMKEPLLELYGNAEVRAVFEEGTRRELREEVAKGLRFHTVSSFSAFSAAGYVTAMRYSTAASPSSVIRRIFK